jgi:hypothetical protein
MIEIRAVPGRVARLSPRGQLLSDKEWTSVPKLTPYLHRLVHVWGDVEIKTEAPKASKVKLDADGASSSKENNHGD